ncbi:hypothetical protein [Streptomyces cinereoruber]|uniref:hypothetical protein n=1 Tax=Streptomyces cinereoruber TaxID=67260 RepID=UPI003632855C
MLFADPPPFGFCDASGACEASGAFGVSEGLPSAGAPVAAGPEAVVSGPVVGVAAAWSSPLQAVRLRTRAAVVTARRARCR